jgi:hypothetical protein
MSLSRRINKIHAAVENLLGVKAKHATSVPVRESFQGQIVWEGVVEVFDIPDHPKAKRAYGWVIPGPRDKWVAVLESPPVTSPETAVRAYIVSLGRK